VAEREAAKSLPGFEVQPLANGEKVVLVNQDGVRSNPVRAKVTERIRGDCVFLVHGWGQTARKQRYATAAARPTPGSHPLQGRPDHGGTA